MPVLRDPQRPSASTPTTPGLTGYDSDSSYTSSQPVGAHSQAGAASASSPSVKAMTLNSLQNPGPLAAIAERERKREGVLVLSDEEEEEGEGEGEGEGDGIECEAEAEADGSDAEERVQGPEAGQLRQGVEGERVVRTGYLDKKGERRKVGIRRWPGGRGTGLMRFPPSAELATPVVCLAHSQTRILQGRKSKVLLDLSCCLALTPPPHPPPGIRPLPDHRPAQHPHGRLGPAQAARARLWHRYAAADLLPQGGLARRNGGLGHGAQRGPAESGGGG